MISKAKKAESLIKVHNVEILVIPNEEHFKGLNDVHAAQMEVGLHIFQGRLQNHRVGHELQFINEPEKNNEVKLTETNSGGVSSYGVRTSSLLIFIPEHRAVQLFSVSSVISVVFKPENNKMS